MVRAKPAYAYLAARRMKMLTAFTCFFGRMGDQEKICYSLVFTRKLVNKLFFTFPYHNKVLKFFSSKKKMQVI